AADRLDEVELERALRVGRAGEAEAVEHLDERVAVVRGDHGELAGRGAQSGERTALGGGEVGVGARRERGRHSSHPVRRSEVCQDLTKEFATTWQTTGHRCPPVARTNSNPIAASAACASSTPFGRTGGCRAPMLPG